MIIPSSARSPRWKNKQIALAAVAAVIAAPFCSLFSLQRGKSGTENGHFRVGIRDALIHVSCRLENNQSLCNENMRMLDFTSLLQGDHSGCVKPPIDIKTKVPFSYEAN